MTNRSAIDDYGCTMKSTVKPSIFHRLSLVRGISFLRDMNSLFCVLNHVLAETVVLVVNAVFWVLIGASPPLTFVS